MTNTKSPSKTPARAGKARATGTEPAAASKPSRLDQIEQLLTREGGSSIPEMVDTTGWQQHSLRGAMAGALKKRGFTITSEKVDGVRRYHATVSA